MDAEKNQNRIPESISVKGLHRPGDARVICSGTSGRNIMIVAGERTPDGAETFFMTDGFGRMLMTGFQS